MVRLSKCAFYLFVAAILSIRAVAYAAEETVDTPTAKDLTSRCTCTCSTGSQGIVRTRDLDERSHWKFPAGNALTYTWTDDVPIRTLYIEWFALPGQVTLLQTDGEGTALRQSTYAPWQLTEALSLEPDTRAITLRTVEEADVSTFLLYGAGTLPKAPHAWKKTPEKLDYLVIAMHPDDDILFLGGIVPIFGAEQGYTGTVLYMASRNWRRCEEAVNGLWTMGGQYYPLFGGFYDVPNRATAQQRRAAFQEDEVVQYLVTVFRHLRPEVVVSQDINGEYGHFQHKILVKAVLRAAELAGEATYDTASATQYGVWNVKKIYLHLYPEQTITLDMDAPLQAFDGMSAFEVDVAAFSCHVSQRFSHWAPDPASPYFAANLGLAHTIVGTDTGNDIFENIPAESLFQNGSAKLPRVFPKVASQP